MHNQYIYQFIKNTEVLSQMLSSVYKANWNDADILSEA